MKLLISDVDGSLLPFGHTELSPSIVAFFHELQKDGVRITLATGKPFARTLPLAKILGITIPLICANGALIKDPVTQKTLFREPIAEETVRDIINLLANDPRCQLYPETDHTLFFVENPAIAQGQWRHHRPGWAPPTPYDPATDLATAMPDMPHKIAVSTSPVDREAVETLIRSHVGASLNIFHPKPDVIDLTSKNVDKGTAAHWLLEYLHVDKKDVTVIGDEINDLPLFEAAKQSLARDHAPQAVLDRATITVHGGDEALILALKQALAS
jgi:Cof subfamily protein (haloacid dehalogenase superfamily)